MLSGTPLIPLNAKSYSTYFHYVNARFCLVFSKALFCTSSPKYALCRSVERICLPPFRSECKRGNERFAIYSGTASVGMTGAVCAKRRLKGLESPSQSHRNWIPEADIGRPIGCIVIHCLQR